MMKRRTRRLSAFQPVGFRRKFGFTTTAVMMVAVVSAFLCGNSAIAYQFKNTGDWTVEFSNSLQYTLGVRAQELNNNIGNNPFFHQGDYKYPDRGDIVTNRIQDIIEFTADHQGTYGFRVSGSAWKDFAYDEDAEGNPTWAAAGVNAYPSGEYSHYTKKYFMRGADLLDAFTYLNTPILGKHTYIKAGRVTQFWGNALFFGFSNIAYSQHPMDFIKGFTQPGSEIKELFLPRTQVLFTTEFSPELSVSAQYFFEYEPSRYPESGTYLGFFDIAFNGNPGAGALAAYGITANDGYVEPDDVNSNFGVKVTWAPSWADGELGFYYRQFDEVHPWLALINPATGHLQYTFAEDVKLIGIAYERAFGMVSTGFELNTRFDTALNTTGLSPSNEGATGTITNFIANTMIQLGTTPLYDCAMLLAEMSYTHLNEVTGNEALYNDADLPGNSWKDGGATDNAVAINVMFTPTWLQAFPSVDLEMPMSFQYGVYGNPAYAAGAFFAQEQAIYSIGLRAILKQRHYITLSYNGYHARHGDVDTSYGLLAYAGFGGNGAVSLNDRGWVSLTFKTSF